MYNSLNPFCSFECKKKDALEKGKKEYSKPNKVSKKQAVINSKYIAQRIKYLSKKENQICFIDRCNKTANTIEHTRGRGKHFFDENAKENNICMTLDERFWKPCCNAHNLELENNPEMSKKYQKSKLHKGNKY